MDKQGVEQRTQHTALWNATIQNKGRGHAIAQPNRRRSVSNQNRAADGSPGIQALELGNAQRNGYECIKSRAKIKLRAFFHMWLSCCPDG